MTNAPNALQKHLERIRFERAVEAAESLADHRALLTTAELARLNSILTGKNSDPWRREAATIALPGGKREDLALIVDPVLATRDTLHQSTERAEAGQVLDAAVLVYSQLVLSHAFSDANRRTAVLAALYFFRRYGFPISGLAIHEIGLGDIRDPGQLESLRETLGQMMKFAQRGRG